MARVMVVDDEALVAQAIGEVLATDGYEVVYADVKQDLSREILGQQFDLLLTDIFLNGTSGWDVIRMLRQSRPTVPIVAISGGGVGVSGDLALRIGNIVGADEVLAKPIAPESLLAAVGSALRAARRHLLWLSPVGDGVIAGGAC